jgi:Trypsin-like peptidase domain
VVPQIWVFFGKDDKHLANLVYVSTSHDFAVLKIDAPTPNYFALCDTPPDVLPTIGACLTVGYPGKDGEQIDIKGKLDELIRNLEGKQSGFLFPSVQKAFHDDRFSPSRRNATVTQRPKLKRMEDDDKDSYLLSLEATIRGGNSGGPLLAKDGTVIGINTWSKKDSDIDSFAFMMHQLRREIDRHAPGAVWRTHPE